MKIIKKKRLYCYSQKFRLKKDTNSINFINDQRIRYIIVDHKLNRENWYIAVDKAGMRWEEWLENNWWPLYSGFDDECEIEELTKCAGWNGLYQLFPVITPGHYIEFIISVEFDTDDCNFNEEELYEIEDINDPDFLLSKDFYVLNRYDSVMLGWGDDEPDFDIDDGSVKWDVVDRDIATLIFSKTLIELFAENKYGYHSELKPYKSKISIKGKYCD